MQADIHQASIIEAAQFRNSSIGRPQFTQPLYDAMNKRLIVHADALARVVITVDAC
jgi:hypothetical protein